MTLSAAEITLYSPDKQIEVILTSGDEISCKVNYKQTHLFNTIPLSLHLHDNGWIMGNKPELKKMIRSSKSHTIPMYGLENEVSTPIEMEQIIATKK